MKNAHVAVYYKKKMLRELLWNEKNIRMDDNGSDCSACEKSTQLLFHNVAEGILLDSKRVKSILPSDC